MGRKNWRWCQYREVNLGKALAVAILQMESNYEINGIILVFATSVKLLSTGNLLAQMVEC